MLGNGADETAGTVNVHTAADVGVHEGRRGFAGEEWGDVRMGFEEGAEFEDSVEGTFIFEFVEADGQYGVFGVGEFAVLGGGERPDD